MKVRTASVGAWFVVALAILCSRDAIAGASSCLDACTSTFGPSCVSQGLGCRGRACGLCTVDVECAPGGRCDMSGTDPVCVDVVCPNLDAGSGDTGPPPDGAAADVAILDVGSVDATSSDAAPSNDAVVHIDASTTNDGAMHDDAFVQGDGAVGVDRDAGDATTSTSPHDAGKVRVRPGTPREKIPPDDGCGCSSVLGARTRGLESVAMIAAFGAVGGVAGVRGSRARQARRRR